MARHAPTPRPPFLVWCVMWLMVSRNDRRTVTSDLREMYEQRQARDGERAAAAWWQRQWRQYPFRLLAERVRRTLHHSPRRLSGRTSVVAGIAGAIFLTRYMSSVLFEVKTTDAVTFATVSVVMLGIALLACFVPARRAAGLDPAMTLRDE